tara:strand:- start:80 stop:301 length:222 start_codon:yes stop_codon:yes gene_type:complete
MLTDSQIENIPEMIKRGMPVDTIKSLYKCSDDDVLEAFLQNIYIIDDDIDRLLGEGEPMNEEEWYVKILTQLN